MSRCCQENLFWVTVEHRYEIFLPALKDNQANQSCCTWTNNRDLVVEAVWKKIVQVHGWDEKLQSDPNFNG